MEIHTANIRSQKDLNYFNFGSELKKNSSGFSLVELLIAMVTGIMVLAGIYASFNSQQKLHTREQLIVDAEQNVRGAIHYMVREIRLAGMDENKL